MVKYILNKEPLDEGKNWLQIVAILLASLSATCTGMFMAWPSPFITKISEDKVNYDITEEESSYFAVLPHLVALVCCPIFSKLCDIIGRKHTLLLAIVPQLLVLVLKAFARSVYVFYLARSIVGISDGIVYSTLPMYIGEISTPYVRGSWGNAFVVLLNLGVFFINVIGIYFTVQQTSYICLVVPISFAVLFPLMPESPYFYLMKGREKDAEDSLRKLRRKKHIEMDFIKLKRDVDRQMSESGSWEDLLKITSNRKALIAAIFVRISQQLTGILVFVMYTKFIFRKSGSNIDSNMITMIFTGSGCLLMFSAIFTVDRLGRKKSYIWSLGLCTISLAVLSLYFYIDEFSTYVDIQCFKWIPVAGMIWFLIFSSFGVGPVPTIILGEIFSSSVKSKGIAVVIVVQGISNAIVTYLFYFLGIHIGFYSPFLFFTVCSMGSILLTLYILPETSGKTLEEIQQTLKGNLK